MPAASSPKTLQIWERRRLAFELRKAGVSYAGIAEAVKVQFKLDKYTQKAAFNDVMSVLKIVQKETLEMAAEVRAMDILRLDDWLSSLNDRISSGDISAIQTALKIQEQRTKLIGIYEPTNNGGTLSPDGQRLVFGVAFLADTERSDRIAKLFERARKRLPEPVIDE